MKIGLAEVNAQQILKVADAIANGIVDERDKRDNQTRREFAIDYEQKFFFRLWNIGLKDAVKPMKIEDLTKEVIDKYLNGMYKYGWKSEYAWGDLHLIKGVIDLAMVGLNQKDAVASLQTIYINQEQAKVINLR